LAAAGYQIATSVVSLSGIGVPQRRRRHTLLAFLDLGIEPADVLRSLPTCDERSVRWAIDDLEHLATPNGIDVPSRPSAENERRIGWLYDNDVYDLDNNERPACHRDQRHSYKSMYGRLMWDQPAQTITTGFGSMGQGRFVHPSQRRTLTPHEAARLQFFPDWFDFTAGGSVQGRGKWATMIGNAVPPKLTMELGSLAIPLLN
jgi:DNA (cytosine-5)-methyltransferase 1